MGPTMMAGDQDLCGIVLRQWLFQQKQDCYGESEAIGLKPVEECQTLEREKLKTSPHSVKAVLAEQVVPSSCISF